MFELFKNQKKILKFHLENIFKFRYLKKYSKAKNKITLNISYTLFVLIENRLNKDEPFSY